MNMAKKNKRNEKGSVTLFVLVAMLFFMIVVISVYSNIKNKELVQAKNLEKIKYEYEKYTDMEAMDNKYEEILGDK